MKLKTKLNEYRHPITAMIIVFVTWVTFYAMHGFVPFGKEYFFQVDAFHQYVPFINELRRKIFNDGGLFLTWNIGAGLDFWANYTYYLSSPFNLIAIFIPEEFTPIFMMYLFMVKDMLMAFTMGWAIQKILKINNHTVLLGSLIWSLCGFTTLYIWNVMWMDVLIIYPLLIASFIDLMKTGKKRWYIFWLALSIWCCFYMSIMVCMSLVVLFFVFNDWHKDTWAKGFLNFSLSSLTAGGVCAVLLFPAVITLMGKEMEEKVLFQFFTTFSNSFSQFFLGAQIEPITIDYSIAPLYCSVGLIILIYTFFISEKISFKYKICAGIGILFLLLSTNFWPLNFLMHGFHMPVGIPNRFVFLLVFLLIVCGTCGVNTYNYSKENFVGGLIYIAFLSIVLLTNKDIIIGIRIFNIICMLSLWCFLNLGFQKTFIIWTAIELMFMSHIFLISTEPKERENFDKTVEILKTFTLEDYEFYAGESDSVTCAGLLMGHASRSGFTSMFNKYAETFNKFGFANDKNQSSNTNADSFLTSLFGIKYYINASRKYFNEDFVPYKKYFIVDNDKTEDINTRTIYLYKNDKEVSNVHVFPNETKNVDLNYNSFENTNEIYKILTKNNDKVYNIIPIDFSSMHTTEELTEYRGKEYTDIIDHFTVNLPKGDYLLKRIPFNGQLSIINYKNNEKFPRWLTIYNQEIINFSISDNYDYSEFTITYSEETKLTYKDEEDRAEPIIIATENDDAFNELNDIINNSAIYDVKRGSNSLTINIKDKEGILTVSSLYQPGWSVKVNGEKREVVSTMGGLLGVEVNENDTVVEFTFVSPGFIPGLIISIIFMGFFIVIILDEKGIVKKKQSTAD